jgi:hypothetical protein
MADSNEIQLIKKELEKAIKNAIELFEIYKEISKEYQEQQKILMNNKKRNKDKVNQNLSEVYLVDANKEFLKKKEKIRKVKKEVLSSIKTLLSELEEKMDKNVYNKFLKKILSNSYELSDKKRITFKTLMHHLESGEISNQVAKTTKKIEELKTIYNVINRKKKMEIGIKQKEIEKILKEYEKIMESLKKLAATKFPTKEITNEDIEALLKKKYSKENSPEFRKIINKLGSELRILNFKIQTKMKDLQTIKSSS